MTNGILFKAFNITARCLILTVSHLLCFLQIWNQYFSAKDTVYAVIPVSSFPAVMHLKGQCAKLSFLTVFLLLLKAIIEGK